MGEVDCTVHYSMSYGKISSPVQIFVCCRQEVQNFVFLYPPLTTKNLNESEMLKRLSLVFLFIVRCKSENSENLEGWKNRVFEESD